MKIYVKSNSFDGYLYIFKHGLGPGTIPKDVAIVKEKDLPNGYTAVWLDRFLRTNELKAYDIPSETEINRYLDRIGYCQKDGDVVPCDDVEVCDKVTASIMNDNFEIGDIVEIYTSADGWFGEYKVIREAEPEDYVRLSQNYMQDYSGTKYLLKATEPSFVDETIETSRNMRKIPKVEACGDVKASDTEYFANMVNASKDVLDDDFLVEGYYDNQRRGLAESAETSDVSALNELINEYANKGYYIVVHNLTDGVITEFSADNWFDDLAKDGGASLFMTW